MVAVSLFDPMSLVANKQQMDPFLVITSPSSMTLGGDSARHPSFVHLGVLVLSAVLEVVVISLPGYILAKRGMFDTESQKFLANLNVMLFTPCLIFTKLGSQLSPSKLPELAIIPVIFLLQTLVSWGSAVLVSWLYGFKKRPRYFVTAMAVFGNSNSLPISLVISLANTIPSLQWDKVRHDNRELVAARGILYLMIFQQLGQLLRWSWGYNYLLVTPENFTVEEGGVDGHREHMERRGLLARGNSEDSDTQSPTPTDHPQTPWNTSGSQTPTDGQVYPSSSCSTLDQLAGQITPKSHPNGAQPYRVPEEIRPQSPNDPFRPPRNWYRACRDRVVVSTSQTRHRFATSASIATQRCLAAMHPSLRAILTTTGRWTKRISLGVWDCMNPPLWALLIAVVIASIPRAQDYLFQKGTFVNTSVTSAVNQCGLVAVPLILVVLGANLANKTSASQTVDEDDDEPKLERKLLVAALVSRMLLPTLVMGPVLALFAKFVPVSILDDPVFVVVAFLLTGAPAALQLAQICQLNNVYLGAMTKLLFQSYVIWLLPSTLVLVMAALEVVKWAG